MEDGNGDELASYPSVGQSLFEALQSMRLVDKERTLWIDAICIDQANLQERNQQVRRMGEIYRQATRVLVWLGQSSESSRAAFSFVRQSYERSPFNRTELMHDPGWQHLNALAQNSYWSRVWIVQEICLGSRVLVMCGDDEIPWAHITELRVARKSIWPRHLSEGEQSFMRSFIARIDHQRELSRKGADCRLWNLLESFKESDCQETHDKIYGFMGLCTDIGNEGGILIDYSKSINDLYRDVIWLYYGIFRGTSSPPHAPQLMALSISLRNILQAHNPDDWQATQLLENLPEFNTGRIQHFLSQENAENNENISSLVQFLEGRVPHSHLGPWRDWIDPVLIDVSRLPAGSVVAISHVPTPYVQDASSRIERPTAFVSVGLDDIDETMTSENNIIGIAPPGTQVGDLVSADEDTGTAMAVDLVEPPHLHTIIGRAAVDWSRSTLVQEYESRIGPQKEIETARLLPDHNQSQISAPWPMTFVLDTSTAEHLAEPDWDQAPHRSGEIPLNMFPMNSLDTPDHAQSWQRKLKIEELERVRQDLELQRHALGARLAGIINLGATGYLSCVLQVLGLLKSFRESILQAQSLPNGSELQAVQEIFRHLQASSLPVSPVKLTEALGWKTEQLSKPQDMHHFFRVLLEKLQMQQHSAEVSNRVEELFECKMRMTKFRLQSDGRWGRASLLESIYDFQVGPNGPSSNIGLSLDSHGVLDKNYDVVLERLPPVLTLMPLFSSYNFREDKMEIKRCHFEFASRLNLTNHFMVGSHEIPNAEYQLHCVVVREDVEPTPKFLLYVRPRQENRWLLLFNDQVTWARESEVFAKNFEVNQKEGVPGNRVLGLLLYLQVTKLHELLD
ncbi:Ubiquitin carboxyl-terminal hydrolase [Paramyrothecium foliicola]|nr:Ubiquitin carboxyl-terminal hydrolase [Paramyrothecium foliicola]